jgi:sulfur carrier protein
MLKVRKGKVMEVTINGKKEEVQADRITVSELLKLKEVKQPETVSVRFNGNFLDRKEFSSTFVQEGDKIEFLYFVGGGDCRG